ncbi:MAG: alpha/beta hydrolase fold domain-containing protein [Prevotella sp.]|nr:alpha/beta hydrolase fold domain-containing protein [Prevotella sp.]
MNRISTICLGLLCFCCTLSAQTSRTFTLSLSDRSQLNIIPTSEKDGGLDVAMLTCYLPNVPSGRAIIDCPGGGYSHLAMNHEGHDWASFFTAKGIAFFVLKYRMPNGDRNIPLGDAYEAFRLVRDSASVWNINPNDLGIMGFSAGGHLASAVSTHAPFEVRPNFSILFYPVISMDERVTHQGSVHGFLADKRSDKSLVREFSSDKAVRRHLTPPAIVLASNDDGGVPPVTNGVAYYSAMRQAGNDCALHIYPTGGHGWGFRSTFRHHQQMVNDLNSWLANLKAPRADAVRVACIGNSITDGSGIDMSDAEGYPAQLQRQLGDKYLVKNLGVGARTMLNKGDFPYMNEMAWRDALAFRPDIAVIKLGTNDSKPYNWEHGKEFQQDMQQMVDSLKALGTKIYLCTPIPAYKVQWGINDSTITTAIIPIIEKVAKKNGCNVIDLHSLFNNDDKRQILPDGIHPNRQGAGQMARLIADAIREK